MSSTKKPSRLRTLLRAEERDARRLVRAKQELASLSRGGTPERPIEVLSSAVIDLRAEGTPCPLCEGRLGIEEHRAPSAGLRAVAVRCRQCGVARTLWFRIVPAGN